MTDHRRFFPILDCGFTVPWEFIAPHEPQARKNHDQSLERLAERGGLGALETLCALDGRGLRGLHYSDESEAEALLELKRRVKAWQVGTLQDRIVALEAELAAARGPYAPMLDAADREADAFRIQDLTTRLERSESELTELKGLFQRTHGCDVSWPREADRLKSELAIATQHGRNLVARVDGDGGHKQLCETLEESATRADEAIARLQSTVTSLRASAELLRDLTPYLRRHLVDDVTLPIGEGPDGSPMALQLQSWFVRLTKLEQGEPDPEIAKLRELVGLESLVRATLKERIDSLSPRRETPWWHATWLSTQPGLYGTAVNRAQGATLFDLMREILKKESGE